MFGTSFKPSGCKLPKQKKKTYLNGWQGQKIRYRCEKDINLNFLLQK